MGESSSTTRTVATRACAPSVSTNRSRMVSRRGWSDWPLPPLPLEPEERKVAGDVLAQLGGRIEHQRGAVVGQQRRQRQAEVAEDILAEEASLVMEESVAEAVSDAAASESVDQG